MSFWELNTMIMKLKYVLLVFASMLFTSYQHLVQAQSKTTVYIVRHGEKDLSDPKDPNPKLDAAGQQRAQDLAKTLRKEKFDAVFSTNYIRTRNTVSPLADKQGLDIQLYDASTPEVLVKKVRDLYESKKIIIAGHSNTVLELVEAFGAERPVKELTEEDYDLLFKLEISSDGVELKTSRYGKPHHETLLKSEKIEK